MVAIKFLADKWREKSSCLAAPCVAINLHWRLCLVLALALSDSFMCCTMYHTYLVSNSLVFLSFGNGFYFFFRNKHVQVLNFFPKCLLSFRSFSFIYFFISALSQIDFIKRNSICISKMLSRSQRHRHLFAPALLLCITLAFLIFINPYMKFVALANTVPAVQISPESNAFPCKSCCCAYCAYFPYNAYYLFFTYFLT